MIVQLKYGSQQLLTTRGDAPTAGVRDFGEQGTYMKSLQQTGDTVGLTLPLTDICHVSPQQLPNLRVPKTAQEVFARHDSPEQLHIVATGRIEACIAAPLGDFGLDQLRDLLVGRCRRRIAVLCAWQEAPSTRRGTGYAEPSAAGC